mmetsp:Transcript_12845/g.28475  ORF Transcript_12845/g.28475 Transcript_12845/m.28475 type:complete len:154 (+) Transcript_12845:273-734(+)
MLLACSRVYLCGEVVHVQERRRVRWSSCIINKARSAIRNSCTFKKVGEEEGCQGRGHACPIYKESYMYKQACGQAGLFKQNASSRIYTFKKVHIFERGKQQKNKTTYSQEGRTYHTFKSRDQSYHIFEEACKQTITIPRLHNPIWLLAISGTW